MAIETEVSITTEQMQQAMRPTRQTASPTNGQTVAVQNAGTDVDLWLTPAGPLAALTVTLPVAGKYVRIRTQSVSGTPTFTFQSSQEVLL